MDVRTIIKYREQSCANTFDKLGEMCKFLRKHCQTQVHRLGPGKARAGAPPTASSRPRPPRRPGEAGVSDCGGGSRAGAVLGRRSEPAGAGGESLSTSWNWPTLEALPQDPRRRAPEHRGEGSVDPDRWGCPLTEGVADTGTRPAVTQAGRRPVGAPLRP